MSGMEHVPGIGGYFPRAADPAARSGRNRIEPWQSA